MKKNWFVILLLIAGMAFGTAFQALAYEDGSYYPKGTTPTYLYTIAKSDMTTQEAVMIVTLQGIVAKTSGTGIWIIPNYEGYLIWLPQLNSEYDVGYESKTDPWWHLDHFKSYIDGYILYDDSNEDSVNAATSLAGIKNAIAVEDSIESTVQSYGLSCLVDVTNRDEAWVKDNYWAQLRHDIVIEQDELQPKLRDYAAMANIFTFFDGNTTWRESVMQALEDDSPCIGWGDGGEDQFVGPSSDEGAFYVAANHCWNLPNLSGITEESLSQQTHVDPTLEENVHYVTFLLADGDNLQWFMGGLCGTGDWWESPKRGNFNMGWGIPISAIDLCPSVVKWYYNDASNTTSAKDYFVVGASGGGYMYPDQYPSAELDLHTERLNDYMGRADLSLVQVIDFSSINDISLWDHYTQRSNIKAVIYLDFTDYGKYEGQINWSNNKPVISAREVLWEGLSEGDETSIINNINSAPRDPYSSDGYSLVMVHPWSKGLSNVQTVIDGLDSDVRVVTPEAFVKLIYEGHGKEYEDTTPPTIDDTTCNEATKVKVTYSEDVDQTSATTKSNYSIDNGITISSAAMDGTDAVILTTSTHSTSVTYTITINNVKDLSDNVIEADSQDTYTYVESTEHIYNFEGITQSNTDYNAYACDVDKFTFAGSSANRNSQVEATDAQYVNISADNTAQWATVDPKYGDEILLWVEMKIEETPSSITQIDLTFNGNTDGRSDVTHKIYVMKAGSDWTQDASWVQVGTSLAITPDVDTEMTRSITSNITDYIDGSGNIIWGVYETKSSEDMRINYLEMVVTHS